VKTLQCPRLGQFVFGETTADYHSRNIAQSTLSVVRIGDGNEGLSPLHLRLMVMRMFKMLNIVQNMPRSTQAGTMFAPRVVAPTKARLL
jgi:hypothetical protein